MTLSGLNIWVTRPEPVQQTLVTRLQHAGATVHTCPLLQIEAVSFTPEHQQTVCQLDRFDRVLFISQAAVRYGLEHLQDWWPQWPVFQEWWGIGPQTAHALSGHVATKVHYPDIASSEGLLGDAAWHCVAEQSILMVKGEGGRTLLADTLTQRGARVSQWSVYRRVPAPVHPAIMEQLAAHGMDVIIVTSAEMVKQLSLWVVPAQCMATLLVPSERVAQCAYTMGFCSVIVSSGANAQAVMDALVV